MYSFTLLIPNRTLIESSIYMFKLAQLNKKYSLRFKKLFGLGSSEISQLLIRLEFNSKKPKESSSSRRVNYCLSGLDSFCHSVLYLNLMGLEKVKVLSYIYINMHMYNNKRVWMNRVEFIGPSLIYLILARLIIELVLVFKLDSFIK